MALGIAGLRVDTRFPRCHSRGPGIVRCCSRWCKIAAGGAGSTASRLVVMAAEEMPAIDRVLHDPRVEVLAVDFSRSNAAFLFFLLKYEVLLRVNARFTFSWGCLPFPGDRLPFRLRGWRKR